MATANERLDRWMAASFLTNEDLAKKVGVDHSYISYMRNGRRDVTDSFRWRFAQVYGYDFAVKLLEPTNGKTE